ncbi:M20/M25/M40 family metallo-hydrolase [Chryseolinea sp. T2]|uniref:M20/M25/M40 family metallo-hydrolase n=1 Tax=Chryseolinea sp. T2 TaxID=3129255 RepID=UPI0030775D6F
MTCVFSVTHAQAVPQAQTDSVRVLNDIKWLADDRNEGRAAGSEGEQNTAAFISSAFKKLGLQPKGDKGTFQQKFSFNKGVHGEGKPAESNNIIAFLDNKAVNTIIVGAHYDHLGNDGQGSSLDANPENKIHNGADDNASGVAGVLELARHYSTNKTRENNNFLFICFSGEELGLLGSKYFTEHPAVELEKVNYMINMDMVGRLDRSTRNVFVTGTGTSPVWQPLLQHLSSPELIIKMDSSGTGPSDHTSFYLKDIPVLHFFTGSHSDYHKPSDDWEKINASGEAKVLDLIIRLNSVLDSEPKLAFLKTRTKSSAGRASFKVTLGIMPSYAGNENGLKVDGVSDGRPGQKAGIQSGDIIIEMGTLKISDIEDYMKALGQFDKGQTIPVKVRRSNEVVTLSVTF